MSAEQEGGRVLRGGQAEYEPRGREGRGARKDAGTQHEALWAHAVEVVLQAAGAAPLHRRLQVLQVVLQCCLLHRLWLQWLPLLQASRDAGLCQRTLQLCCPRHLRNAVGAAVA